MTGSLIRKPEGQKKVAQHFSSSERELSTQNSVTREEIKIHFHMNKNLEDNANRSTLKEWLRKFSKQKEYEEKESQNVREEEREKSKNMNKYNTFFFPFEFLNYVLWWGKNHNTV